MFICLGILMHVKYIWDILKMHTVLFSELSQSQWERKITPKFLTFSKSVQFEGSIAIWVSISVKDKTVSNFQVIQKLFTYFLVIFSFLNPTSILIRHLSLLCDNISASKVGAKLSVLKDIIYPGGDDCSCTRHSVTHWVLANSMLCNWQSSIWN